MVQISTLMGLLASSAIVAAAPAAELSERASCTFSGSTGAAAVAKSKTSCSTITLSNLVVPAGTTLDLTKLTTGTKVNFHPHPL
jgi:polygalacturonase